MNYIIAHCNPENNWLSTNIATYTNLDGYTIQKDTVDGLSLSGNPVFDDFVNVVNYFILQGSGQWQLKQIKCTQASSYEITREEPYTEEITYEDENGDTITETISGVHLVVDEVVPILDMRIVDLSLSIANSERFYFKKTTDLPKEIEKSVIDIWKHLINNNDV